MIYNQHNLNVAKIAAKSGSREELTGVLFLKDKTVATDGYRLLEVTTPAGADPAEFPRVDGRTAMRGSSPFIADKQSVLSIPLPKGKTMLDITKNVAVMHLDNTRVDFLTANMEGSTVTSARRIDRTFPDYEKIIPKTAPRATVTVTAEYLRELLALMGKMHDTVHIAVHGEREPLVLTCESMDGQKARALLMPVQVSR